MVPLGGVVAVRPPAVALNDSSISRWSMSNACVFVPGRTSTTFAMLAGFAVPMENVAP
jgi:hypothetical protein